MDKYCLGCGIKLQNNNDLESGYVRSMAQDYCASCFRLKHYGDLSKVTQVSVDPFETLNKISQMDALLVWVIDLFHLNESHINGLVRWFQKTPVVLLVTKRELLPKTMSTSKIVNALHPFIMESHLNVVDVLVTGNYGKMNRDDNIHKINRLKKQFKKENVVFFGKTNVGKSSVINALTRRDGLSVSLLPGTTIDLIKVQSDIENLFDSAGIGSQNTILNHLSFDAIKKINAKKPIKPINYQLKDQQSLIIDGFGIIDLSSKTPYSVTCYFPEGVTIHRTKSENALDQFQRLSLELNELIDDKLKSNELSTKHKNTDIVIMDIGFVTVHGSGVKLVTRFKESVEINLRKALL